MFNLIPNQETSSWICSKAAFCYVRNRHIRIIFHPLVKWKYNKKQDDKHNGEIIIWANGWHIHTARRLSASKLNNSRRRTDAYQYLGAAARTVFETAPQILCYNLLTSGKLNAHLAEIDRHAEEIFFRLIKQMANRECVTEQLKAENQMEWVQRINNIHNRATGIVYTKIIYILYISLKKNNGGAVKLRHYFWIILFIGSVFLSCRCCNYYATTADSHQSQR